MAAGGACTRIAPLTSLGLSRDLGIQFADESFHCLAQLVAFFRAAGAESYLLDSRDGFGQLFCRLHRYASGSQRSDQTIPRLSVGWITQYQCKASMQKGCRRVVLSGALTP